MVASSLLRGTMILSCASPEDVLSWFESGESGADVLCLLLAPSKADRDKARELFDNFLEYDALMGEKIHFILFAPDISEPIGIQDGGMKLFPGRPLFQPFRNAYVGLSDFYRGEATRLIADKIAWFVPALMRLLGVGPESLPALCVLVQGVAAIQTIKLDASWNEGDLQGWLRDLAKITYRTKTDRYSGFDAWYVLGKAQKAIRETDPIERAIEARRRALEKTFRTLSGRNRFDQVHLGSVARFLNSKQVTSATLESLLRQLPIDVEADSHNQSRLVYLRKVVSEIEGYEGRLSDIVSSLEMPEITLPALQEHLQKRNQETMELLEDLASKHGRTVNVKLMRSKLPSVESVAKCADNITTLVKKLAWLGPPIKRVAQAFGVHIPE